MKTGAGRLDLGLDQGVWGGESHLELIILWLLTLIYITVTLIDMLYSPFGSWKRGSTYLSLNLNCGSLTIPEMELPTQVGTSQSTVYRGQGQKTSSWRGQAALLSFAWPVTWGQRWQATTQESPRGTVVSHRAQPWFLQHLDWRSHKACCSLSYDRSCLQEKLQVEVPCASTAATGTPPLQQSTVPKTVPVPSLCESLVSGRKHHCRLMSRTAVLVFLQESRRGDADECEVWKKGVRRK